MTNYIDEKKMALETLANDTVKTAKLLSVKLHDSDKFAHDYITAAATLVQQQDADWRMAQIQTTLESIDEGMGQ